MLWLVLTWLALIALWGASDRWNLGGVRRRVFGAVHDRARAARTDHLD